MKTTEKRARWQGFIGGAWLLFLGLVLLFVDFVSKAYVFHILPYSSTCVSSHCVEIPVFENVGGIDFMISLAVNKGAAWGLFANFQLPLLILRIVVIFAMLIYLFFLKNRPLMSFSLVLISAGALGNVIDFFLYGYVIDFLSFNLWGFHFPIFNFADSCITIGVALLFLIMLFSRKKKLTSTNGARV